MPGIRIQHEKHKSATLTLVDQNRPYREPYECPVCHRVHTFKTYHLMLDEAGAVIVSEEIVAKLKALPQMGGFRVAGEVKNPPPIIIRAHGPLQGEAPVAHPAIVEHDSLKEPI